MSDFGDDIITISDEDGNDYELLVLDEADLNGVHYMALTDNVDIDETENVEVNILKVITDESGEEMLSIVEDPDELAAIYQVFEDRMFSEDDEDDQDDQDDE